jgi:hypothetical protein
MPAIDRNAIGERGEAIFVSLIMKFHGNGPLFRPAHLGAKWPIADFVVELVRHPGAVFLVQVKATRGRESRRQRLRTGLSRQNFNKLAAAKLPTYIIGVDERREIAFISAAVKRRSNGLASIPARYSLGRA